MPLTVAILLLPLECWGDRSALPQAACSGPLAALRHSSTHNRLVERDLLKGSKIGGGARVQFGKDSRHSAGSRPGRAEVNFRPRGGQGGARLRATDQTRASPHAGARSAEDGDGRRERGSYLRSGHIAVQVNQA